MYQDSHQLDPHKYEAAGSDDPDLEVPVSSSIKYKRYGIHSRSEWLLEVLTAILSCLFLGGIFYLLFRMSNKPLSDWPIETFSLNSAIAILASFCVTCMMHGVSEFIGQLKWLYFKERPNSLEDFEKFDEASRSVWGSIKFFAMGVPRLATIGALITILKLGLPTLVQQSVHIDQRLVNTTDSSATFGYAHMYDRGMRGSLANSREESVPQDPGMQSAIVQGLYGINSLATFSCPGACFWKDSYLSIGFKSECKNVTQETLKSKTCFKASENSGLEHCNMTTPGGLGISTRNMETDYATSFLMNASSTIKSQEYTLPRVFPELVRFAIYRSTSDGNFASFNTNITDCSLSLTAYRYTTAMANGTTFRFGEKKEVDFGRKNPWNLQGTGLTGNIYTNASQANNIPLFNVSRGSLRALQIFLESDTIVTEWVDGSWYNRNFGLSSALTGNANITERFEMMATSMTDYVRSGPNTISAKGERSEIQPFFSVNWYYFIGAASIELLSLAFAILTMWANRKSQNVPLWKCSALAILFCQLDKKSHTIRSTSQDIEEMEKVAKDIKVKLK